MNIEFTYNISNYIKALQILEPYIYPDKLPYSIVDEYRIVFNTDYSKVKEMPPTTKETLEELGFTVMNGYVYTEEYNT